MSYGDDRRRASHPSGMTVDEARLMRGRADSDKPAPDAAPGRAAASTKDRKIGDWATAPIAYADCKPIRASVSKTSITDSTQRGHACVDRSDPHRRAALYAIRVRAAKARTPPERSDPPQDRSSIICGMTTAVADLAE